MRVSCAFYGLANQASKTELVLEREQLRVGELLFYRGDRYVILSVFEEGNKFHANVALERIYKAKENSRPKPLSGRKEPLHPLEHNQEYIAEENAPEDILRKQLFQTEMRLNQLLAEREELVERIDKLIQQLDNLQK